MPENSVSGVPAVTPDSMTENPLRPPVEVSVNESDEVKLSRLNASELRALVKTLASAPVSVGDAWARFVLVNPDTKHHACQWCGGDLEVDPASAGGVSSDDSETRKRSRR